MTLIFVNGGGPTFPGSAFTTGTEALTQIRNNLVTAGWTTITDTIPTLLVMRGIAPEAAPNNHNCWFRFSIPSTGTIRVVGDRLGDNTSLSANYDLTYTDSATNNLYLSADTDAFCLAVKNPTGPAWSNLHGGFVERVLETDQFGWMIGRLDQFYATAQWARGFITTNNWQYANYNYRYDRGGAGDYFVAATGLGSALGATEASITTTTARGLSIPYWTTMDRFTSVIAKFNNNAFDAAVTGGNNVQTLANPFRPDQGRLNAVTGTPFLGTFFYIENNEGFRGFVRFAAVGLSSLAAGAMTVDPSGKRWLSVGPPGIQGFRIA
jgi:hypothetical protein